MASSMRASASIAETFETPPATPARKGFWGRGDVAAGVKHCLYCGMDSTPQELAVFSSDVLGSNQPVTDVCPHCTKLDGFRQQQEWVLTAAGKYLYQQAKSRFSPVEP
jgi:hypothetical protein